MTATVTLGKIALLGAVAGAHVTANDTPTVTTTVGSGKTVNITGDLLVESLTQQQVVVDGTTYAIGLGVGIGVIDPTATAGGTITTGFDGTVQNADHVTIRAVDHVSTASTASGVAGSLLGAADDITTTATTSPAILTSVGGSITATHDIVVESVVFTDTAAVSEGIQISLVASVGVLTANATDSTSITTQVVGGTLTSTSGNMRISSLHDYDQATNKLLSSHETLASIESVSASLLVQVSTANVSSDARTTTIATTDGSSRLSAVGGTVTVEARSANLSLARAKSSGGALVSVSADINPHATSEGVTRANLLGDVSEGGGPGAVTIGVVSDGFDLSTAVLDTSTGGLVDIQANTGSHATTNSTVSAQLGDDAGGSVVNASNDITLRAGSITDADATTRSASGGGINMHVYSANADTTPHIDVKVGAGTNVTAPTVTVDAEHDTTPPTYSDGIFNAAPRSTAPTGSAATRSPSPPTTASAAASSSPTSRTQRHRRRPHRRPQVRDHRPDRLDEEPPARRGVRRRHDRSPHRRDHLQGPRTTSRPATPSTTSPPRTTRRTRSPASRPASATSSR